MKKDIMLFSAVWCTPCKAVKTVLAQKKDAVNVTVYDVDSEEDRDMVVRHNVQAVPTLICDGKTYVGSAAQRFVTEL